MRSPLVLACVLAMTTATYAQNTSSEIRIAGSPQMSALLNTWEKAFQAAHPNVHFRNELHSTITAVGEVALGHADLGALGRELWPTERDAFRSARGHDPFMLAAAAGAYDVPKATFALMVFVHRSNPINGVSLDQLRLAFFAAPDHPYPTTWKALGLYGPHADHEVHVYGFEATNDKSLIFRDKVAHSGDRWSDNLRTFDTSGPHDAGELILSALANDPDGLAVSNIHYATPGVRVLPLLVNGTPIAPTRENVANQRYPLSREVYLVADPANIPSETHAFLAFIASPEGQAAVTQAGDYLPLPPSRIREQAAALSSAH